GGGSMTPNIADQLAAYLNLPKNRVAIRGIDGVSVLDKDNQHVLPNGPDFVTPIRSEEHTSELQSRFDLVCRLLLEKKKNMKGQYLEREGPSRLTKALMRDDLPTV